MIIDKNNNSIHPTSIIYPNVTLGKNNFIGPYCVLGYPGAIRDSEKYEGRVVIGDNNNFMNYISIMIGKEGDTVIGDNNLIMNYVNIGHNVSIGSNNEIGVGAILGGHCSIHNNTKIKLNCTVRTFVSIGDNSLVGMGSNVVKDVPPSQTVYGNPAKIKYK